MFSGCAGARAGGPEVAARAFYAALSDQHGARACELLAPSTREELEQAAGKPCEQAVLDEQIDPATGEARAEVYGTMAQIRWAEETTFLTRFQDGWRVLAAGCALGSRVTTGDTNDAGDPEQYECSVRN